MRESGFVTAWLNGSTANVVGLTTCRTHDVQVVDIALLIIEKHRRLFAQRPTDIPAELCRFISGRLFAIRQIFQRVARVAALPSYRSC